MKYNQLGNSGLRVSVIGLGCNNFGGRLNYAESEAVIFRSLDLGINLIDTSDTYTKGASEEFIGRAIQGRRADVIIATKFGNGFPDAPRASRTHVIRAAEDSLRRLGTDYIDLFQLHRADPTTPVEETLRALEDLIRQGKIRYAGSSNFAGWRMVEAAWAARANGLSGFIASQEEYSLLRRGIEGETLGIMERYGIGLLAYAPLARGMLSGKYVRGEAPDTTTRLAKTPAHQERYLVPEHFDAVDKISELSSSSGIDMVELSLAWLASRPAISSILVGAMSPEQVESHVRSLDAGVSPELLGRLSDITQPPTQKVILG